MNKLLLFAVAHCSCSVFTPERASISPVAPISVPNEDIEIGPAPEDLARDLCARYCDNLAVCSPDVHDVECVADCSEILASEEQQRATNLTQDRVTCYGQSVDCGVCCK